MSDVHQVRDPEKQPGFNQKMNEDSKGRRDDSYKKFFDGHGHMNYKPLGKNQPPLEQRNEGEYPEEEGQFRILKLPCLNFSGRQRDPSNSEESDPGRRHLLLLILSWYP